jgi:autotransporter-associated beta strand protein
VSASYSGVGEATGNIVTISGAPNMSGTIYIRGGVSYSNGDTFTGNTLNKNSDVSFNTAGDFEDINFGYNGDANIDTLDTTPSGSSETAVNLNTDGNNIDFNGDIIGAGGVVKQGNGELGFSGTNSYTGDTTVSEGALKITGGLDIGSGQALIVESGAALEIAGTVNIANGGTLDNYGTITGAGILNNASGSTANNYGTIDDGVNVNDSGTVNTESTVPQNFTATPSDGSVSLSWSALTNFGGGTSISKYQVTKDNWATIIDVTSGTAWTFSGLSNGTRYVFKVRAVNDNNVILAEASATATPTESAVIPSRDSGCDAGAGMGILGLALWISLMAGRKRES